MASNLELLSSALGCSSTNLRFVLDETGLTAGEIMYLRCTKPEDLPEVDFNRVQAGRAAYGEGYYRKKRIFNENRRNVYFWLGVLLQEIEESTDM